MRREIQRTLDGEGNGSSPPYRVLIAPKGRKLLNNIREMDDCFIELKQFLSAIPQKVTQRQVEMLFSWGTNP